MKLSTCRLTYLLLSLTACILALASTAPSRAGTPTLYSGIPTIYSFGTTTNDGDNPASNLVADTYGNLWGTCTYGGANGEGTVFEILKGTTKPITVYSFYVTSTDGENPNGGLCLARNGNLYGTTLNGGTGSEGTLYQIVPSATSGGTYSLLYSFSSAAGQPEDPIGTPVQGPSASSDANLYFCTEYGGTYSYGTVVSITTSGTSPTFYSFGYYTLDGHYPQCSLCLAADGYLYGTCTYSSTKKYGTLFQIPRALNPTNTTVYTFTSTHQNPVGGVVQGVGSDTNLYGTLTDASSSTYYGDIFKCAVPTLGGTATPSFIYSSTSVSPGDEPYPAPIVGSDGYLYGNTALGGSSSDGSLYRALTTTSTATNTIYNFTGTGSTNDGENPVGALLYNSLDGYYYGTTEYGGIDADGTLYRFGPPSTSKNYFFTSTSTAVTVSLPWSDLTWNSSYSPTITESAYSINGGTAATTHGTLSTPLSSTTAVPASPFSRTYTPTTSYVGIDTFNYTVSNSLFGISPTANGVGTVYIGTFAASATQLASNTATLAITAPTWTTSDTTLTYTWATTGTPPAAVTFAAANGTNAAKSLVATFTAAGTYNLKCTVTAPDGTTTTVTCTYTITASSTFAVTPATASIEVGATQSLTSGQTDQFGNVTAQTSNWSITSGGGSLSAASAVSTTTYTAPTTTGTAVVKAISTANSSNTATSTITITSTAPTSATASATPNPVTAKTTALSATASYVGLATNLTYTWAVTSGPSGVTYSANGTYAARNTTATFTQAGTYIFTVTIANPGGASTTASVTVTVTTTAASITISPAYTSSSALNIQINTTQQYTATVKDQFGNTISSPSVTWSTEFAYSTVSTSGLYTATLADGQGADYVQAASGSVSTISYINVVDATMATPTVSATPNPTTTKTTTLTGTANWAGGNSYLTYTWTTVSVPTGGTITYATNGTNASSSDVATFNEAGTYKVTVTANTPTTTAGYMYSGQSVTSASYTITVTSTATMIAVTPTTTTATLGGTAASAFTAVVKDQFGTTISTTPTWSVSSGPGTVATSGLYTAPSYYASLPTTATVTDTVGSATGSGTVTVSDSAVSLSAITVSPSPVTGTSASVSVTGTYAPGSSYLTYTWSGTATSGGGSVTFSPNGTNAASSSTATFTKAGTYTLTVTASDGAGGTATKTLTGVVVNQTLTTITVTPNPATLNIGSTQTFAAVATDQFGTALATQPTFTWTIVAGTPGSINASSGLYTAGTVAGSGTVKATSGSVVGSATVTVNDVAPSSVTASANPNPVTTGKTTTLTSTATYPGTASQLTYTWSVTSSNASSVSFDSNNGTSAGSTEVATFSQAGTYTFLVTVTSQNGLTGTKTVSVVVQQAATSIVVSPSPASVVIRGTVSLTASEIDQFGNALTTQPTFTWSITTNQGTSTVSPTTGATTVFTAGSKAGTAVVQVTDGTLVQSDNVLIQNALPVITVAAAASPSPATGTTTTLSVTATWTGGTTSLTYTWAETSGPATVAFDSNNGTTAGNSEIATFSQAGTYVFTVTVADPNGGTKQSSVSVTVTQTLTSIAVTPNPSSMNIGDSQTFAATGNDQFGNPMGTQPTFTWSVTTGVGSINSSTGQFTAGTVPGTATVQAASGSITGTAAVTVNDVAPTVATAAAASPNPTTATTTSLSVLGAYLGGENELTYTWSRTSGPAAVTFSANGTNAAKSSTATFTVAGTYVFKATITDPSGTSVTSSVTVTVYAVPATVTVTPATASVTINGTQAFAASVVDQFGNALTSSTITWSLSNAAAGTVDTSGNYTAGTTPGSYTLTASATAHGITSTGSSAITVTDASPTLGSITVTPSPVTGTTATLKVTGSYSGGGTLTYAWTTTSGPASVTFSGGTSGTAGSAVTSTATFTAAGTYTAQVTVTDVYGTTAVQTVTFTVSQTPTSLSETPATANVNIDGSLTFTSVVYDQFTNAISPQPTITWAVTSGGGSVSSSGVYSAPAAPGTAVVSATSGSLSDTSTVTIQDPGPTVATAATATPNPVTGTTTALSVLGAWVGGESNLTYTWVQTDSLPAVTFSGATNGTNAAKNLTATFGQAGTYTFVVTIADPYATAGTGKVTSSVTVTVSQASTTIVITPASATLPIGGAQAFSASAIDQFGNALATQPTFVWSKKSGVGTINSGTGYYTAGTAAGSAVIKATSGSVSNTANITVSNVAPTVATAAAASPSPATGTTTNLTVLGAWVGGESNLTYTWAETSGPAAVTYSDNGTNTAKNTVATFTQAGTYGFTVTIADPNGGSVTSSVTVTVSQTATSVSVSPTTASVVIGGAVQITDTVYDQFGNVISPTPTVTWSVSSGGGSVSTTGVYSAPTTVGTATVTATIGSASASATITINDSPPSIATAASATPNPVTGTSTALSVQGAYPGGESNLTYTWSYTGPTGVTYSGATNGTNAAKNITANFTKIGTYTFTVTIANPSSQTATSQVVVNVVQSPTTITVTPNPGSVLVNQTLAMSAAVVDQFGNTISSPTVSWSVLTGAGSINSSTGVYTAPATTGTATVQAAAGSATGTATINITKPAAPTVNITLNSQTGTTASLSASGTGTGTLTYAWSVTPTATGSVSPTSGTSTTLTVTAAGTYTVKVVVTDTYGQTGSDTQTVVFAQTPTTVTVTPNPGSVQATQTLAMSAAVTDQFGNTITTPTVSWSKVSGIGSINASTGVYTAPAATGTAVVQATSGSATGNATINVTNPAAPSVNITLNSQTSTTASLSASGTGTGTLTYAWSVTPTATGSVSPTSGTSTTLTVTAAGTYTVKVVVTDTYGQTGSDTQTVVFAQTPTTVTVTPNPGSVQATQTLAMSAAVSDQFGNTISSPTVSWSKVSGIGSINASTGVYTAPAATGTAVVQATSGSATGNATINVTNPAAPTVNITLNSQTGTTASLSASGTGTGTLTYAWSVTPTATGSVSPTSGTSTTLTVTAAGTYTVKVVVTDTYGQTGSDTQTVVFTQTPTTVTVTPNPGTVQATQTLAMSAAVSDQFGNTITTPTVSWSKVSGIGSINASTGVYTAPAATGTAVVQATSGSATGNATINVTNPPAPTVSITLNSQAATTASLTASGTGTGTLTYAWSVTPTATGSVSPTSGTSTTLTVTAVGTYTVKVTLSDSYGQTGSTTKTVTFAQIPTTVTVTPNPGSVIVNQTLAMSAVVADQFGNTIPSPSVTWSVTAGGGSINASSGVYTAPATTGTATVQAADGSATGTATINITKPAAPTVNITLNSQTATTASLSATGSGTGTLTYSWTVTPTATGSVSPATGTSTTLTVTAIGTYTVKVTASDSFGQTGTNTQTVVFAQVPTTVTVTPNPGTVNVAGTLQMVAAVSDQFGNTISSPTVTWSKVSGTGSINSSTGLYTAGATTGTATVQATSGTASGTATINVVLPTAPTVTVTLNSQTNTTASLSASGTGTGTLTYAWSVTPTATGSVSPTSGTTTTLTATAAGTYTVTCTVTDSFGQTGSSGKNVTFTQIPTTISVTPTTVTMGHSATQAFTATENDQFGKAISSPSVTWSAVNGTITSAGLYTSPATGTTDTITVKDATTTTIKATATVTLATKPTAAITLNSQTSTSASLTGSGTGSSITYAWSVTPTSTGSVSPTSGTTTTLTATAAGTYVVTLTVTDAYGQTASITKNVIFTQTATAVTVSPSTANISTGGTQTFAASETDQFGKPMTTQPTFTWSVMSGGGSVTSAGVYTAPATSGSAVVQAKAGSLTGVANVTITQPTVGAQLTGSVATPGSLSPNFTTEGTSDWAHWGRGVPGLDHKSTGASQIGGYTEIGTATVTAYRTDPRSVTWSDGTPTASSTNQYGVSVTGTGNGFTITAPADNTKVRTLIVYVGGTNSAGKLTATLSDGSAAQYSNIQATNPSTTGYDFAYTITYAAGSAGKTLTVSYTLNSGTGSVRLCGATLH